MNTYHKVISEYPLKNVMSLDISGYKKNRSVLRAEVLKNTPQCLITKWNNPYECECAHIVPRCYGYDMSFPNVNHTSNCCLLSNGIHALFDSMQWTLDIYYFLNNRITDEYSFCAKLILTKNITDCNTSSILSAYKNTIIKVPIEKYASFMMHYYAYHAYNFSSEKDLGKIYQRMWDKGLYNKFSKYKTVSELKTFILNYRKTQIINNLLFPIVCINGIDKKYANVIWDYYDYSFISKEPISSIKDTEAYNEYISIM
uniref:HNH nuclease domain-containing protein n=1 Tax=viral metagenome TaxID=1070528 RepID=A0A6C0J7T7_9ZZZZ